MRPNCFFRLTSFGIDLELALFALQGDLLLDMYLHNHVETIYQSIRKKALVQYFSPFLSVDMHKMAQSFNTTVNQLESEVATLVMDGQIQARIDSHNKVRLRKKKIYNWLRADKNGSRLSGTCRQAGRPTFEHFRDVFHHGGRLRKARQ